ncbi:protein D3 isoform X2 [Aethina tumida]|uniref:protein D3 isoform X2 n=1 Tax=Aethina tumida TaxID=116153 RepID=UPI0021487614|nr:protein D3 isoform X2 [Aethina tumida]
MHFFREIRSILLIFILTIIFSCAPLNYIKEMLDDHIVPDSIDEAPSSKLTITFDNDVEVNFGEELTPTQVKNKPEVSWDADHSKFYLLSMTDPDAPSRDDPKFREYNHWLVGNIPGDEIDSAAADVLHPFQSSGPPKGTGLHRYVFLVYEQKEKLNFKEPRGTEFSRANRKNFSIRDFAKKYKLGNPVAGNYYQSQWDKYVEERNKKFSD